MTWTAQFIKARAWDGTILYSIVYTDGARKFERQYSGVSVTDASVRAVALAEVAGFERADTAKLELTVANGAAIDLTPDDAPPDPTASEIARNAFATEYRTWQRLSRGLAAKLVAQADVDAQLARVAETWTPEFAEML